ncbi:MAG: O-antigen ligase family protein [Vicinamibacterales bacterium]|jgi:O-antigen ligase|nr:O-antigen ligase family protein [Vicinamibacterales bacterium]
MSTTIAAVMPFRGDKLEAATLAGLLAFVAALQLSIAAAGILLAVTIACWLACVATHQERVEVPRMFWPLAAYAGATVLSALFSADPSLSLVDCKQLLLFLIVPIVYRVARGDRALTLTTVIITVGALSAVAGIVQYGILHYDNLGRRPQGTLTHYMTYSGTLMLVAGAAAARLIYRQEDRVWAALVMPAVLVALALTFTRSAWVGAFAALAVLMVVKDRRLLAVLPVAAALFIAFAPARVTERAYSMFDLNDPTNRDRVAMLQAGVHMVSDHPLTGLGPNMVRETYAQYRVPTAVEPINVHLHNVPMHIAAERGLPALAIFAWFVGIVTVDMLRRLRTSAHPSLAAAALAAVVAMLAAGLFEYNFGDSEFLMLFLVLVTLPYAAERQASPGRA